MEAEQKTDTNILQSQQIQSPSFPQHCAGSAPTKLIGNFSTKTHVNGIKCMVWLKAIHLPTKYLLLYRQFPEDAFM